jgi:cell growth-regulating nucleolar protein
VCSLENAAIDIFYHSSAETLRTPVSGYLLSFPISLQHGREYVQVRYGPRDAFRQALANPGNGAQEKAAAPAASLELTIGLSTRPPWECTLCRVKCTSQETLQGHAQGKKHRSKARAAAKAQAEKEGGVKGDAQEGDTKEETGAVSEVVIDGKKGGDAAGGGDAGQDEEAKGGEKEKKKRKKEAVGEMAGEVDGIKKGGAEAAEKKKGKKHRKEAAKSREADGGAVKDGGAPEGKAKKEKKRTSEDGDLAEKERKKKSKKENTERLGFVGIDEGVSEKGRDAEDAVLPVVAEETNGAVEKKSKKRKKGDASKEATESEGNEHINDGKASTAPEQQGAAEQSQGNLESKGKKRKAGKALDEKQYWEELAKEGRKKKQGQAPAEGEEPRPEHELENDSSGGKNGSTAGVVAAAEGEEGGREVLGAPSVGEGKSAKKKKEKKKKAEANGAGLEEGLEAMGDDKSSNGKGTKIANWSAPSSKAKAGEVAIKLGKLRKEIQAVLQEVRDPRYSWGATSVSP